jgi:LysM repeat protein
MVSNCDAFYKVKSGDECATIASSHGITVNQLYTWNTQIGTGCSGLWAEYYICVSVIGASPTSTTTTTGNGISTPTPTQAGMTGSCRRFHLVGSGDSCESIAQDAGITLARFYSWNSGVGSSCGSLWLGYYVCIGV